MDEHTPTTCHWCGQRATGIGIGLTSYKDTDPKWLCTDCSMLAEDIRRVKRPDAYKLKALEMVDEDAGNYCAELGKTDMADMDELERKMLWKTVFDGTSRHMRQLVRDGSAPF